MRYAVLAVALLAAAQGLAARRAALLPLFGRPVLEDYALSDVGAVSFGLRRMGADLAFIQLLQYYASTEWIGPHEGHEPEAGEEAAPGQVNEGSADLHPRLRLVNFSKLREHILRIGALDPYFHYAFLFGAGALAFNLNRPDEAFEVLRTGAAADPEFWRYRLYAGAIAFRESAQIEKVIPLLEEAARDPDCPTMLMNILANIYRKIGAYDRAADVFQRIIANSRDEGYVSLARQKLKALHAAGKI
jgi:tetratricopeptide (TPR) repeat protein